MKIEEKIKQLSYYMQKAFDGGKNHVIFKMIRIFLYVEVISMILGARITVHNIKSEITLSLTNYVSLLFFNINFDFNDYLKHLSILFPI